MREMTIGMIALAASASSAAAFCSEPSMFDRAPSPPNGYFSAPSSPLCLSLFENDCDEAAMRRYRSEVDDYVRDLESFAAEASDFAVEAEHFASRARDFAFAASRFATCSESEARSLLE